MSLRLALAASAVLAFAGPVLAQETTPPAPVPAAAPPSGDMSPELMVAAARIEALGAQMDTVMADLEPRAAAVRADAALSDADKETRIRAMIAEHQPAFDEFAVVLVDLIRLSALSEGASAEDAAAAAAEVPARMKAAIEERLITGATDEDDAVPTDGHEDHEGH